MNTKMAYLLRRLIALFHALNIINKKTFIWMKFFIKYSKLFIILIIIAHEIAQMKLKI
jgi:hypothetical protein